MPESDSGEQTEQTGDLVSIHEASMEDLDNFLSMPEEDEGEKQETEPAQQQTREAAKPEVQEDDDKVTISKSELAKMAKMLEQKEGYIQRRNTDVGNLRKQIADRDAEIARLQQGLDDKFLTNPKEAFQDTLKLEKNLEAKKSLEAEEQEILRESEAREVIERHLKPEEIDFNSMAAVLRADGIAEEYVNYFQQNPLRSVQPETLIQLAKRSAERTKVASVLKNLVDYTKGLESQLEKANLKPKNILKKIQAASQATPQLSGQTGGITPKNAKINPALMSDAELDELINSED